MKQRSYQRGFTLIELVIVIVILGILVSASTNVLVVGFNSFFTGKNIVNAEWQVNLALERMVRDLRITCSSAYITPATNSITITDMYNNTINYQVTGTQLVRKYNNVSQVVADGVQSLSLAYYSDSALLTNPSSSLSQIRYLVITLTMNYNSLTFPITTVVYLWNLK